jgi:hypothetical protein
MIPILALSGMQLHLPPGIIASEYSGELAFVGNHRAVKYAVGSRQKIAWDDGVVTVPPYDALTAGRLILPRYVGQRFSDDCWHGEILSYTIDMGLINVLYYQKRMIFMRIGPKQCLGCE